MSSPQEMWDALPPVTRTWLGVSVVSTALVSFGTLDVSKFLFFLPLVYQKLELWRLFTCFVFFGKFSFNFLMQMMILARFSASQELDPYRTSRAGGSSDYLFSLIFMGLTCLVIAWAFDFMLMGPTLLFAVLYLWSKRNPDAPTSIWGFRIKGAQLPWAFIALNVLIGGSPMMDLIGVFVGHLYYFLAEVMPLSNNRQILTTPEWLIRTVDGMTGQAHTPVPGQAVPGRHNWGTGGRALGATG
mmetsp:Transcript_12635/g.22513  ORF Transcript_12635/g.22513 Transcript_12635/m.22513 type:complete len:243 (-) Transcript_12635:686-1414(-)|eukprot:CAMPEP_0184557112 /NCGR_PEP_ID=MMETSP0199_2-20130426/41916_1 /TAXON_ID=1112570 /ORGANISM="Thraustochytrium sp., Strain LLF1b" /LENGTH=242 /DNA_ID=CAMNT_0026953953 /DNA_START=38 /DNA_END=766 /DNA_ORIENTATION=-